MQRNETSQKNIIIQKHHIFNAFFLISAVLKTRFPLVSLRFSSFYGLYVGLAYHVLRTARTVSLCNSLFRPADFQSLSASIIKTGSQNGKLGGGKTRRMRLFSIFRLNFFMFMPD